MFNSFKVIAFLLLIYLFIFALYKIYYEKILFY